MKDISLHIKLLLTMRLLSLCFLLLLALPSVAQKKEIDQVQTYIKSRTNLDKAESAMRTLLKDSANRRNIKIYEILAEAVRMQYVNDNEKLYLKEKFDTAAFFNITRKMFIAYESLDSIDAQPDKKGRVKLKFRKKNAKYLDGYRQNLYNGGLFFIRKKACEQAYDMFDTYLDCAKQPLFTDNGYEKESQTSSSAAFWTLFCGYKLNSPDKALKYSDLALQSNIHRRRAIQYLSEAYLMKKDTASYVKALRTGFSENKQSKFFFTRLMDYYNDENQLDSAMSIVNIALAEDGDNNLFLFAKSNVLLNLGKYAECIAISDTLIARQDTLPDIYLNAGVSYMNLALIEEKQSVSKTKTSNKKKALTYYNKALPYMEKYRILAPEDKDKWAAPLYNIYFNLNMGRQFEEISRVLRDMRQ